MDDDEPQWLRDMRQRELDQFTVGTEVIVTLNGECQRGLKHGDQEDGMRGVVIGTNAAHIDGHPIWVHFRHRLPVVGSSWYYAPGEVRPFDIMAEIERLKQAATPPAS